MAESNECFVPLFSELPSFISLTRCVHSSPNPFTVDLDSSLFDLAIDGNGVTSRSSDASLTTESSLGKGFSSTLDTELRSLLFSPLSRNDGVHDTLRSRRSSAKALTRYVNLRDAWKTLGISKGSSQVSSAVNTIPMVILLLEATTSASTTWQVGLPLKQAPGFETTTQAAINAMSHATNDNLANIKQAA